MKDKIIKIIKDFRTRFKILNSLFSFLWENKIWWMIPMIIVFVIFFGVMIFAQSSPLGPFIYTLF